MGCHIKISVIVPIHGVEKYIEKCAVQLLEQDYPHIEYLFIDDCTQDASMTILHEVISRYEERRNQILIHRMEKNSGFARVREWGIKHATGDYIWHIDGDDWIENGAISKLVQQLELDNPDMLIIDYKRVYTDHTFYRKALMHDKKDEILDDIFYSRAPWIIWNKIAKRELYDNKLLYPKGDSGEDMVLTLQLIARADKISYLEEALYNYRKRPDSWSFTGDVDNSISKAMSLAENIKVICDSGLFDSKKYFLQIEHLKFKSCYHLYKFIKNREAKRTWRKLDTIHSFRFLLNKNVPLNSKYTYLYCLIASRL